MVLVVEQGGGKWFVPFFDIFLQLQTAKWSGPQGREQKGSEGHTGLLRADLKGGRRWGGASGLHGESSRCLTMCCRCVGAAGFDSWAGEEMSW